MIRLTLLDSLNYRLQATPRSPHTAAAHYFDDTLSRSAKPRIPGAKKMRRSSTSRSIGNRSDHAPTIHGDGESVALLGGEEPAEPADQEADEHVDNYVADQLQSHASLGAYEDEFETQPDTNGN
jgi:hypothetical protein